MKVEFDILVIGSMHRFKGRLSFAHARDREPLLRKTSLLYVDIPAYGDTSRQA